ATVYGENRSDSGDMARAYEPRESSYRNIEGDLRARFCRSNLTIGDVGGRVDVENDFGDTVWQPERTLAQKADHRIVSQSGAITLRLGPRTLGSLKLQMGTECGKLRRGRDVEKALSARIERANFETA